MCVQSGNSPSQPVGRDYVPCPQSRRPRRKHSFSERSNIQISCQAEHFRSQLTPKRRRAGGRPQLRCREQLERRLVSIREDRETDRHIQSAPKENFSTLSTNYPLMTKANGLAGHSQASYGLKLQDVSLTGHHIRSLRGTDASVTPI